MSEQQEIEITQQDTNMMGPGARLRIAREATRLTVNDIARYLHLKPEVIHDIENDDYSRAPRIVFLRGYIRSYAKLMNLPADEVVAALDKIHVEELPYEQATVGSTSSYQGNFFEGSQWLRWVSAIVAAAFVLFVAMWWHWQKVNSQKTPASETILEHEIDGRFPEKPQNRVDAKDETVADHQEAKIDEEDEKEIIISNKTPKPVLKNDLPTTVGVDVKIKKEDRVNKTTKAKNTAPEAKLASNEKPSKAHSANIDITKKHLKTTVTT